MFQDLIPGHDEGDPSKRLTRYKLYYIVCSFLCKYVINYLESETERTHLHVDARLLLVGHVGPVLWMCMMWAVCGTSAHVVHSMWGYCIGFTCYMDVCGTFCIGCACYVDVCGTTALNVHALWIYVLLMHWLYMLYGLCGTIALVVHAMWMYVGPLHTLYMPGGCVWVHCTGCV